MWLFRTFFNVSGCLFGLIASLIARTCLPKGYSLQSQVQVNNFPSNYPECVEIPGYVSITSDQIAGLSGLNQIQKVDNGLSILLSASLTGLQGMNNLTEINGDMKIRWNNQLYDLLFFSIEPTLCNRISRVRINRWS
ncbi:MAG: hypothetical protein H6568_10950 [Lewinellaceae bacterium]|nr:hypothetical protein [Saprospiraceae bacterium]MCB9313274.1 hypothetical protein [Lewinellaceae bacterium]